MVAHKLVLKSFREGATVHLIVYRGADIGKSMLLNAIVNSTKELFKIDKVVQLVAATRIATFSIGGATTHHKLVTGAD